MIFLGLWLVIDMFIMISYAGIAKKLLMYKSSQIILFYLPGVFMTLVGTISLYLGTMNLLN
ncbi:MAG: hypothetical protein V5786_05705 [Psychromonas sp.]